MDHPNGPDNPAINVDRRWWRLNADTGRIAAATDKWSMFADAGDRLATALDTAAKRLFDQDWQGQVRTEYEAHEQRLRGDLAAIRTRTAAGVNALRNVAGSLRAKQGELSAAEDAIIAAVPNELGADTIRFKPVNKAQSDQVMAAVETAKQIRNSLDTELYTAKSDLTAAADAWKEMSDRCKLFTEGADPFTLPPEALRTNQAITLPDGTVIVNTGGTGDDDVKVTTNKKGEVIVEVNGKKTTYPPGTKVTVRGGEGDDEFDIDTNRVQVTVLGGEGNDEIESGSDADGNSGRHTLIGGDGDDKISTGGGSTYVSTGAGDDEVKTGTGNDVISTGAGRDHVEAGGGDDYISTGPGGEPKYDKDGNLTTPADFADAGAGDDQVFVGEHRDRAEVEAGDGNDLVLGSADTDEVHGGKGDDTVYGGAGNDYIDGQKGDDHLYGGDGNDVVYGLNGRDELYGGEGSDYLEGGRDNDVLDGGSGTDVVSGGRGDDTLSGGSGNDVLYAGEGKDTVDGGVDTSGPRDKDTAYVQTEDNMSYETEVWRNVDIADNDFIDVRGSDDFKDRIQADLDMYSSSPTGRRMIDELHYEVDKTHDDWKIGEREVVIKEYDKDNGSANNGGNHSWSDVNIHINPEERGPENGRPSTVLYHELAHGYDFLKGTSAPGTYDGPDALDAGRTPNDERQAAGLEIKVDGEYRIDPDHPLRYTENGLREEMGLEKRDNYRQN